jgi:type III restriction enzyme
MKFQFKIQPFQTEAAESVVKVFAGQPNYGVSKYRRDVGTTKPKQRPAQGSMFEDEEEQTMEEFETAYRNAEVELTREQLLKNIRDVQMANNIKLSSELVQGLGAVSLDVEMETGTGKTYVYIKTMFELHKAYGWSKFIVVVPSIAIREGVKKTFEITQEHFMELYGLKARFFVYNSSNLHQLDEFSQNSGINVMIINTQAFNTTLNEEKNVPRAEAATRLPALSTPSATSSVPVVRLMLSRPTARLSFWTNRRKWVERRPRMH